MDPATRTMETSAHIETVCIDFLKKLVPQVCKKKHSNNDVGPLYASEFFSGGLNMLINYVKQYLKV